MRTDVIRLQKLGEGYEYHAHCPKCRAENDLVVTKETHLASVAFLAQVATDRTAVDLIVEPLGSDEEVLAKAVKNLETMTDDEIWSQIGH